MECCFCNGEEPDPLEKGLLGQKAYERLLQAAVDSRTTLPPTVKVGAGYHNKCRLRESRRLQTQSGGDCPKKRARVAFPFRTNCVFCGVVLARLTDTNLKVNIYAVALEIIIVACS